MEMKLMMVGLVVASFVAGPAIADNETETVWTEDSYDEMTAMFAEKFRWKYPTAHDADKKFSEKYRYAPWDKSFDEISELPPIEQLRYLAEFRSTFPNLSKDGWAISDVLERKLVHYKIGGKVHKYDRTQVIYFASRITGNFPDNIDGFYSYLERIK